ncbi:hypothetical protein COLO4_08972 [Corchorus olitorius]|uniref:Uncharacterized protein n=1 Tax=Corchorus olitorius TaxID=93759 RepID=A0A1R3KE07_9ROSI|nr:hypothetical protein COLO4_08972 [Corchorus olitorius]
MAKMPKVLLHKRRGKNDIGVTSTASGAKNG